MEQKLEEKVASAVSWVENKDQYSFCLHMTPISTPTEYIFLDSQRLRQTNCWLDQALFYYFILCLFFSVTTLVVIDSHWSRNLIPLPEGRETEDPVRCLAAMTDHWDSLMTHDLYHTHIAQKQKHAHRESHFIKTSDASLSYCLSLTGQVQIDEPITSFALQGKPAWRAFTARLLHTTPGSLI